MKVIFEANDSMGGQTLSRRVVRGGRLGRALRCVVTLAVTVVGMGVVVGSSVSVAAAQVAGGPATRPAPRAPRNDGSTPEAKTDERFVKMHAANLARAKAGPVGLLFMGDSITAGWATRAKDVFEENYGKYQPANFGIGGDKTQNVLWRMENGELEGIRPRVVVLMIGTNNSGSNTAAEISGAITKIVGGIQAKLPETKVLLLAVFPRGPRTSPNGSADDGVTRMGVLNEVNATIAKLDDGKRVRFLNLNEKFLVDGKIPESVMPDQLHPTKVGYETWAAAMRPLLEEMMKE